MMAELDHIEVRPRGSLDFTESSILGTIIPLDSDLNIEDSLGGSLSRLDSGDDSPLASIAQRQALYFDETVAVYVILQTPYYDEKSLRTYLGRLAVNLEAQVVNAPTDSQDGSSGHEVIFDSSIKDTEDPLIIVQGSDESGLDDSESHILVVWKISTFLVRPRLRLQNPSIVFSATANLKTSNNLQTSAVKEEYLPSQQPSTINMLEAFGDDPSMGGIKPRLSALRVSRVIPSTKAAMEIMRPLKNISRQSFKVYPCLNSRVKYSRPSTAPASIAVIASVDIDVTPFANCEITLNSVDLKIVGGSIEDLNARCGLSLPFTALPQDDITLLYRLQPDELEVTTKSLVQDLEISITATAHLSKTCQPQISMRWVTSLSFIPPVNPGFGHPTPPIQRPHRPAQLSIGSVSDTSTPIATTQATDHPDALPATDTTVRHTRTPSTTTFGITITFTNLSDSKPIYPGIPFTWSVFIVNRSERPRKLALMVIPKRRRTEARITRPPSTGHAGSKKDPKVADAVVEENIVHAMQKSSAVDATDVVCLSTDTRVGPLAPGACYDVELRFMALRAGILSIEAVRVVDVGTQEHVDVRDLPSIIVSCAE